MKTISKEKIYELLDKYNFWSIPWMPTKEMMDWPQAWVYLSNWKLNFHWKWDYWVHYEFILSYKDILETIEFYNLFK